MKHLIAISAVLFVLVGCATQIPVAIPKAGPNIVEIDQIDSFPIGAVEDESEILAQSDKEIELPTSEVKTRSTIFSETIIVSWVQNGSGIDLLKVNQSLNDTWQLLNETLDASTYTVKSVNDELGKVSVILSDPIIFLDASSDSFSVTKSKNEDRFEIEFRVDAVDDGTVISLQFEDDLLLPSDDNLIHLDNIRQLMIQ